MYRLKVSLPSDANIRLEPIGPIEDEIWDGVVDWWSSETKGGARSKFIEVGIAEFSHRKLWLRENWTSLGYDLTIDDEVRVALRNVDSLISEFLAIASRDESTVEHINLDSINLNRSLTDFQERNLRCLISVPNGANFSVPGAGKTLTTLALWEFFRVRGDINRMLVVCPRSAFAAWEGDANFLVRKPALTKFSDEPISSSNEILYVNYEQLENSQRLARLVKWMRGGLSMLVIDEAHRIKGGGGSVRWRACRELSNYCKRVDLLTGTPMPQGPDDLRNLFSVSWPGIPREVFSDSRLSSLRRGGVFVRTTKRELNLPPTNIETITLPMSRIQKDVYAALKRSFMGHFKMSNADASYFGSKGKSVMTLIGTATNPGLLMRIASEDAYLGLTWPPRAISGEERLMSIVMDYASHEIPKKYEWVLKYVSSAAKDGRKILIWSTLIANLRALERLLSPYAPALIYGASSEEERMNEICRFRTSPSCSVLLSNPQTLGEGISLHHECHEAIYLDRSYNAGLYLQSLDRIHRLGLPESQETKVFLLETEGTIDQRISRRLEDKIERLGFYLNDEGLVEVSLPGIDDEILPEGISGLDDIDLNDLYSHLMENE